MTDIELNYKVRAISTALERWNDAEALRLLRLAWADITVALHRKTKAAPRKKPVATSEVAARKAIPRKTISNGSGSHQTPSTRHH
jgi:hypothetical protein